MPLYPPDCRQGVFPETPIQPRSALIGPVGPAPGPTALVIECPGFVILGTSAHTRGLSCGIPGYRAQPHSSKEEPQDERPYEAPPLDRPYPCPRPRRATRHHCRRIEYEEADREEHQHHQPEYQRRNPKRAPPIVTLESSRKDDHTGKNAREAPKTRHAMDYSRCGRGGVASNEGLDGSDVRGEAEYTGHYPPDAEKPD